MLLIIRFLLFKKIFLRFIGNINITKLFEGRGFCNDADAARSARPQGKECRPKISRTRKKRNEHYAWRKIILLTNNRVTWQKCRHFFMNHSGFITCKIIEHYYNKELKMIKIRDVSEIYSSRTKN